MTRNSGGHNTSLPVWQMTCTYTLGTLTASSYGLGCGTRSSLSNPAFQWNVLANMNAGVGGSQGLLSIITVNNGSASIAASNAGPNLSITAGDSIQIFISRYYDQIVATAQDITTGALVRAAYTFPPLTTPIMPNTARFGIYNIGGTQTLTAFNVSSGLPKGLDLVEIFDSKGFSFPTTFAVGHPVLLQNYYRVGILAGSGDASADFLNEVPEVIALKPKIAILEAPGNDVRESVPIATTKANVASIVSQLQAAGITVYVATYPLENSGVDFGPLNTWIAATYPTNYIDLTHGFVSGSVPASWLNGDTIHPADPYHQWIAQTIANRLQNDGIGQQFPYYTIP